MVQTPEGQSTSNGRTEVPQMVPAIPLSDLTIYPYMVAPVGVKDPRWIKAVDEAMSDQKIVGVFGVKSADKEISSTNLHKIGTVAAIVRMMRMSDGSVQLLLQGISRVQMGDVVHREPYLKVRVGALEDQEDQGAELEALARNVVELFQKVLSLTPNAPEELSTAVINLATIGQKADFIASHLNLQPEERQQLLEELVVQKRFERLNQSLNQEMEILEIRNRIQSQVKGEMDKTQREYYLRQQLKAIQEELGETDERTAEINELRDKIEAAELPEEALKEAERELDRLAKMPPAAAEYTVSRTYLDWITGLPWNKSTEDNLDVDGAEQVLNEDHYGLEKPKERILDYLAVRRLKEDMKGPILCLTGPPGTGKTSLGRSIARALGRKFIRISLGGVRDEAEIRGHRRTYIGALPGRIIQGIYRAGSNNPVFMLDEVDKIGVDFRGDPSSALLEVLDPEQNFSFSDHYLDVPFDLSKVMFITTANVLHTIPPALLDRMEVLELPGYTEPEKLEIAKRFLVPRQLSEHGINKEQLSITDEVLTAMIRGYTREAGLRNLERQIAEICRKAARHIAQGQNGKVAVSPDDLHGYLGPEKFRHELAEEKDEVGVIPGLAWTPSGGEILFVEAMTVPGRGNLTLTGHLGEVMKESAQAAMTYIRSRTKALELPEDFRSKCDVHVHIPGGAIPKDGPSAGVTVATALASALTKRPAKRTVAMTGEITLRGKVLPIGGVRDKILAAHRAGIKTVILPEENRKDLEEVPDHVKETLSFVWVDHMDQVLNEALSSGRQEERPSLEVA